MLAKLGAIHVPAPPFINRLAARARLDLMAAPKSVNWFAKCPADGDPLGNDLVGNCDPVAKLRTIQVWMANAWGSSWAPTKDEAFALYATLTGFNPTTMQPDEGTDTAKAMSYWATTGIRINEQTLDVIHWATLDPTNDHELSVAIATTGPLQITLSLPIAAQDDSVWGQAPGSGPDWAPGSWGTHRVAVGAYDGRERICRTWGTDLPMHPDFWWKYVVAADAALSREWMEAAGVSPEGLDWGALTADMALLSN